MSWLSPGLGRDGGPTTVVLVAAVYALVSLVVDPVVTVVGPFHVALRPSDGLPVLVGLSLGPVGVLGVVAGVSLEAAFVGGDLLLSVAELVGHATVAAVAWLTFSPRQDADDGGWGVASAFLGSTVAAAAIGNATVGALAATVAGFPFAPLAIDGAAGTTVWAAGLALIWLVVTRWTALPDIVGRLPESASTARVGHPVPVAAVGLLWLALASAIDTGMRDFALLPPPVVEQRIPHGVVVPAEFAVQTWWVGRLLQFGIGLVAVGAVVGLIRGTAFDRLPGRTVRRDEADAADRGSTGAGETE